jgi:hypothetical protein
MLPLLMAAGLNLGAASGVCRKLAEASVLVPRDADPLDEFDLGRIVGSDRKAAAIKALRAGGWLPPKERRVAPPPVGAGTVLDADGRVLPAQPVNGKETKTGRIMSELQRLAAEEVADGQSSSNY